MLFEIVTTSLMGGIALNAYVKKKGLTTNDSGKIQRIISLSGLNVKDGKDTLTTQLIRKKKHDWGWEYAYRIPLGRSFDEYKAKRNIIEDGLNNRRQRVTISDLKALKLDATLIEQIKKLWKQKLLDHKEVEISFDGLLKIRVYDEPLPTYIPFHPGTEWKVPVGITREQNTFRYHDFELSPHMVLGGATRYGKSNFINGMISSLVKSQPDNVRFYLIDLKGGVEFCDYENMKHTLSIAYEPIEAQETLKLAYEHMKRMQQKVRVLGKKNVQEAGIKERCFVIIDEVGELNPSEAVDAEEKKIKIQCQIYMSQIARLGAGLGFRQILASQYTTGDIVPRQCKQNSDAKLCFRVQSGVASKVILDGDGAEDLPQIKGRAIYQMADKREILQTPMITSDIIQDIISPYIKKEEIQLEKDEFKPARRTNFVTFEEV